MEQEAFDLDVLNEWGYKKALLVGQGAFARVYRVWEEESGRFLACKVSAKQDMLCREAELMKRISHPLFSEFCELRQREEKTFLFMEFVHGSSLKALLLKRGTLSERCAVHICGELARGLCYLHELAAPVIFRDVKPENIMIRQDGAVKLLDLGSAGPMGEADGVLTGTPGYAAPEQLNGNGKTGYSSDVYALGRVMRQMLTGNADSGVGGRNCHRGIQALMEECVRENAVERIPDMRCFLQRLSFYDADAKNRIFYGELKAFFSVRNGEEYIYEKNIFRHPV